MPTKHSRRSFITKDISYVTDTYTPQRLKDKDFLY